MEIYIFFFLFAKAILLELPGRLNELYPVEEYYGSRVLDTYKTDSFLYDEPSIIKWSYGRYLEQTDSNIQTLFFVDPKDHNFKKITSNNGKIC